MKTGYQIYVKLKGENAFTSRGLINCFLNEEEAIAKCKSLNDTWNKYGHEYIVVKLE